MERQVGPQWADCGATTWQRGKQGLSYGWKRSRLLPAQWKVREWGGAEGAWREGCGKRLEAVSPSPELAWVWV